MMRNQRGHASVVGRAAQRLHWCASKSSAANSLWRAANCYQGEAPGSVRVRTVLAAQCAAEAFLARCARTSWCPTGLHSGRTFAAELNPCASNGLQKPQVRRVVVLSEVRGMTHE